VGKFDDHPFIAIWETTQACDLACKHCRASARPERDGAELDTAEGRRLLESLAAGGVPLVVLTGGDPAKRPDLVELVAHGRSLGLTMGLTPSATARITPELVVDLARAGLSRLAISIDGADARTHDAFRGAPGSFDLSLSILGAARRAGVSTQVNTSIHVGNIEALAQMVPVVRRAGAALWSVFFVVPTGRAGRSLLPSADAVESALVELGRIAEREPFGVKTTAAPHYRRVLAERKRRTGSSAEHGNHGKHGMRVNDGRGFLFVSHRGGVFPSGFLPIDCGNVRARDPLDIYRQHPVFRALRNPELVKGKCGACEYKALCGGSRARAYALSGDFLAEDELCRYVPEGYVRKESPRRWLAVANG
jgi:AdoMet-dependent heme synthase